MQKRMQALTAGGASPQKMADFAEDLAEQAHESARRTARVTYGVIAVMLVVFVVGAAAGTAGALLASPPQLGVAAGTSVAALFLAGFAALLVRNFLALRPPPKELAASGVPARLTVRDYRTAPGGFRLQTGSSEVDFTRVAIDLDVAPAEGAAYAVTVREYLTARAFVKLSPGATLSGYVDRADPGRIFIDWRARR